MPAQVTLHVKNLLDGIAIVGESPNHYYGLVNAILDKASETNQIQSGPAHGRKTKELHPTFAVIQNPRKRIVSAFGRVVNLPFALAEAVQILGGINDPQALKYYNSKIIQIQGDIPENGVETDVTRFNAAYGERLRHYDIRYGRDSYPNGPDGIDQLQHIIETLKADPNSRQAKFVLWHPYWDNYKRTTKDRACNIEGGAMIRQGKLDWMQVMRSNDDIWGLPYNLIQWTHVQEYVATQLGVPMGNYTLVQDSLHVYEDFYADVSKVESFDMYQYIGDEDLFVMDSNIASIVHWEKQIRQFGPISLARNPRILDYWTEVMYVFNAFKIFRQHGELETDIFKWMPYTFELRWPLMRWFCSSRWTKDNKYNDLVMICMQDLTNNGWPAQTAKSWLAF